MTKEMRSNDWNELRRIIDDGMTKRDRNVHIGFYESATLVTISPAMDKEKFPETPKNEPEKSKNEIIVRVPYSKDAQNEMACFEEELKKRKVKITWAYNSGTSTSVETEHYRFIFWPVYTIALQPYFLGGRNVRALVGFSTEEIKEFVGTHPRVLISDCFTDILDLLF